MCYVTMTSKSWLCFFTILRTFVCASKCAYVRAYSRECAGICVSLCLSAYVCLVFVPVAKICLVCELLPSQSAARLLLSSS